MTARVVVDSSVLIDVLRDVRAAVAALAAVRSEAELHASDVTRLEVLAGMRTPEEAATRRLLDLFAWHPLDSTIAEIAGDLGRRWIPGNRGIDAPDLAIAATAQVLNARLLTRNVKHFPMFEGLTTPY
jgi:predicted nucleic acid-binding protein